MDGAEDWTVSQEGQRHEARNIMAVDAIRLVAMAYDKALLSLKAAVEAIWRNESEERWRNNHRAQEIIRHLLMTVDLEKGGEIASNLEALYRYMLHRLLEVDAKNDARAAQEVIELLEPLRASWSELARNSGEFKIDRSDIGAALAVAEQAAA